MDESLFIFGLIFSFIWSALIFDPSWVVSLTSSLLGIIYCFLSTCLGMQIRRSDLWEALTLSSTSNVGSFTAPPPTPPVWPEWWSSCMRLHFTSY